ncbi:prepilin-type N-terminal cleavage/methylation domain-containing protein [Candidatus Aerophobetes bacterium]|uniref:Prepilin-type N-terminal cleavage/methylation domain-containing protein n=1 Tax=Aerophobetes bacterium TaxID=2030807 RepID=A0A523UQ51_UNCAE|nr:MAG: prepilin-type N-terminal cleavage/methylation domain-containing protein [Candidatus Aerophobetes bacterium]
MKKNGYVSYESLLDRLLQSMMACFGRGKIIAARHLATMQERAGFTLIELIISTSLLSMIALLIYPAYRTNSRSYDLSVVESSLQQNARIGMKKIVVSLQEGMVVDVDENDNDWDPSGNNAYRDSNPYFMILYLPQDSDPAVQGDEIALYAALRDDQDTSEDESKQPLDPADHSLPSDYELPDAPLLYMRRYTSSTSSWSDPEPLVSSDVKVTQLSFILGGDNEDEVLITLELAREGPSKEWRTYKLVSAAKLGAR